MTREAQGLRIQLRKPPRPGPRALARAHVAGQVRSRAQDPQGNCTPARCRPPPTCPAFDHDHLGAQLGRAQGRGHPAGSGPDDHQGPFLRAHSYQQLGPGSGTAGPNRPGTCRWARRRRPGGRPPTIRLSTLPITMFSPSTTGWRTARLMPRMGRLGRVDHRGEHVDGPWPPRWRW